MLDWNAATLSDLASSTTASKISRRKHLVVHSVNAAGGQKSITPTETAIILADQLDEQADIIMMQEPLVGIPPAKRMMVKTHPNYNVFSPVDNWDSDETRPRTLTYVRKHLQADQLRPFPTKDVTWVRVKGVTFVNVYRPCDDPAEVDMILKDWTPTSDTVIAGDMNAGDISWDSDNPDYHGGAALANTMLRNGLDLISERDMPTHDDGKVLDLVYSNIPWAEAAVNPNLHCTSDHETLRIVVPIHPGLRPSNHKPCPDSRRLYIPDDRLSDLARLVGERLHELPILGFAPEELDNYAQRLVDLLKGSALVVGKTIPLFRRTVWWNEACAEALDEYRLAIKNAADSADKVRARRAFCKVVRRAKRDYWRGVIESAEKPADLFRVVSWHKLTAGPSSPPIIVGNQVYETQLEKATALRRATLERRTADADIQKPWEARVNPQRAELPFTHKVTLEEAEACTVGTKSNSPGHNTLTVRLLKACWPLIGDCIRTLFQRCLLIGHHPRPFKTAKVIIIPKPGKNNYTIPKAYRPISLLSCLGKGLERLVARRIAWIIINSRLVAPQHFSALPKRSATDLAAALIYDVEQALVRRHGRYTRYSRRHRSLRRSSPRAADCTAKRASMAYVPDTLGSILYGGSTRVCSF